MNETPESILAMHILNIAPVDLAQEVSELTPSERSQVIGYLERLIQRAVLYTEYIEQRHMDDDHGSASHEATKRLTKVRRAMGYAYPDRHNMRIP